MQLTAVRNILRTPRLTTIYQREMARKMKAHEADVLGLIERLNSEAYLEASEKRQLVTL